MKKSGLAVWIFAISMCSYCSVAQAGGWYVSGHAGIALLDDIDVKDNEDGYVYTTEVDEGAAFLAAVGYDFQGPRVEVELGYQKNDFTDWVYPDGYSIPLAGDLGILKFMINGYYDYHNSTSFTPYVTAGFGFAYLEWKEFQSPGYNEVNLYDNVFAYQLGAGVEYAVTTNLAVDLRYNYFGTSDMDATDPSFIGPADAEISSHNIYLGLRYSL